MPPRIGVGFRVALRVISTFWIVNSFQIDVMNETFEFLEEIKGKKSEPELKRQSSQNISLTNKDNASKLSTPKLTQRKVRRSPILTRSAARKRRESDEKTPSPVNNPQLMVNVTIRKTPIRRQPSTTKRTETVKTQPAIFATPKPKKKRWGEKEKADLKMGFSLYNPIEEEDWNRLVEILPVDWTVEEVKAQAKLMGLKTVILFNQDKSSQSTDLLNRIKRLMVSGKMPTKGTLKREEFEDAVQELLCKQHFVENETNDQLQNSIDEDEFLEEALFNFGLDDSIRFTTDRVFTPSKRMFIPKPICMSRRRSSMMAAQSVGDEFVLPNRDKDQRFRRQYRAQQYNRRFGRTNSCKEDATNSADESSSLSRIDELEDESLENEELLQHCGKLTKTVNDSQNSTFDGELIDAIF
ncbi:hypothetical protein M3Y96_00742700 [Aphelenchoides besseyi]|nr:hypothetical protein M3Y96_00742700 [Aphelenchoides besseyi]